MADTTTDVDFGLVHSKNTADAITDSQTHQGKIYFPTDANYIVKAGRKFGDSSDKATKSTTYTKADVDTYVAQKINITDIAGIDASSVDTIWNSII